MSSKPTWISMGCPLSMEKELLAIREPIRKKEKHRGPRLVLIKAAYNEMRNRQGRVDRELKCGSRCMSDLNRQMNIWIAIYDNRTPEQITLCERDFASRAKPLTDIVEGDDLVPADDRRKALELLEYSALIDEVIKIKGEPRYLEIKKENGNRLVKKSVLIQEIL